MNTFFESFINRDDILLIEVLRNDKFMVVLCTADF